MEVLLNFNCGNVNASPPLSVSAQLVVRFAIYIHIVKDTEGWGRWRGGRESKHVSY